MKIEYMRPRDISSHEKNPKIHPKSQLSFLEESIEKFGWTNPIILDNDNRILAGHARLKVAILKNIEKVPVIKTDLSGKEADAYLIADNRLSDIAPWDRDILAELLITIDPDLVGSIGFTAEQIDDIINCRVVIDDVKYASEDYDIVDDTTCEWVGMPEFNSDDLSGIKIIFIFKTSSDILKFSGLINQPLTENTKYFWHPKQIISDDETKLECYSDL